MLLVGPFTDLAFPGSYPLLSGIFVEPGIFVEVGMTISKALSRQWTVG